MRSSTCRSGRQGQPGAGEGIAGGPQGFEEVRPHGSHDAEAAYKKDPELVREAVAARSTAPSALSSSKPSCGPIRAAAPTVSWSAGRSSTTPASDSIRLATSPPTRRPARRWATWRKASNAIRNWNPSSPTARKISASRSNQAVDSARTRLQPRHRPRKGTRNWNLILRCRCPKSVTRFWTASIDPADH